MRFLFTCGGTAGHIYPAVAVAGQIRALMPDAEILFVGATGKMEAELVPREGYKIQTVQITNLQRNFSPRGVAHNLKTMQNIVVSMREAGQILREFRPDVAVGTGGYVCYPVLRKAVQMGIPTAIHESNVVPGLTTKLLAKRVSRVMVGFDGAQAAYKRKDQVIYTGTPVRGAFLGSSKERARVALGIPQDKPLVVSFWGSLGASKMNADMEEFIRLGYQGRRFYHIHATGGGESALLKMQTALAAQGVTDPSGRGIDVRAFIYDMPQVLAAADLVLCRAGASTMAELTAMGKPTVLVPSPYVTHNHQEENAKAFAKGGGAVVVQEQTCTGASLYATVQRLLTDPRRLLDMSRAMKGMGNPLAAEKITEIILGLTN